MIYETAVSLLYIFSTSLLYPDMICLLVLFGWSLILVGSMIQEYTSRRRDVHELEEVTLRAASLASSGREKEAAEVLSGYRSPQLAGVLGRSPPLLRAICSASGLRRYFRMLSWIWPGGSSLCALA